MDGRAAGRFRRRFPREWRDEMQPHWRMVDILDAVKEFCAARSD